MKIEYFDTNQASLELIKTLWERLRDHHISLSTHFSEQIASNTFEKRSKDLREKSIQGQVKIILAQESETKSLIGYCISSIDKEGQGEIDSIYILDEFRGKGVGNILMERTLNWIKNQGIKNICISVLLGNEQAIKFYEKYGFYPRTYLLKNRN
ncbi:GNAT family N-acetyltransferase [Paenibacillus sp. 19GGS1-52]|uniref:GNAT family N-acetyltransferase n=1 Tax=Paenibacillus sp. 19GGS1-52 TaxID=2758563 RepID=UPI001EFBD9E6|nr:GNAT family N-acetyltransferase [Paenibacillus sp. 19GGS1-52]ULO08536.1 GNAT family N-acetyltransferase [Paenibacillus sp. 19GGS1-52]